MNPEGIDYFADVFANSMSSFRESMVRLNTSTTPTTKEPGLVGTASINFDDIIKKASNKKVIGMYIPTKVANDMQLSGLRAMNKALLAFKTKEPEMKYDLKAMNFDPDSEEFTSIDGVWFRWTETPEDYRYWLTVHTNGQTAESRAKIQAMRDQYKAEVLPDIGVLLEHDGSSVSPVAVGTDVTYWLDNDMSSPFFELDTGSGWEYVTHYLIHAHPEPKRITGSVAAYTDTPDFDTWVADDAV